MNAPSSPINYRAYLDPDRLGQDLVRAHLTFSTGRPMLEGFEAIDRMVPTNEACFLALQAMSDDINRTNRSPSPLDGIEAWKHDAANVIVGMPASHPDAVLILLKDRIGLSNADTYAKTGWSVRDTNGTIIPWQREQTAYAARDMQAITHPIIGPVNHALIGLGQLVGCRAYPWIAKDCDHVAAQIILTAFARRFDFIAKQLTPKIELMREAIQKYDRTSDRIFLRRALHSLVAARASLGKIEIPITTPASS